MLKVRNFHVAAVIDGVHCDVSEFSCRYSLNEIPNLSVVLPRGWKLRQAIPVDVAPAEKVSLFGNKLIPIQLYVNGKLLFSGSVVSIQSYISAAENQAAMTVVAEHWLSFLKHTPTITEKTHPPNPYSAENNPAHTIGKIQEQLEKAITTDSVQKDLWGAIKSFLEFVITLPYQETGGRKQKPRRAKRPKYPPQTMLALEALSRIRGTVFGFHGVDQFAEALVRSIRADLQKTFQETYIHDTLSPGVTIWDRLVSSTLPNYALDLVPGVENALVIPSTPTLRSFFGFVYSHEHFIERGELKPQLPIKSVKIFSIGPLTTTGVELNPEQRLVPIGKYESSVNFGSHFFLRPPTFLLHPELLLPNAPLAADGRNLPPRNPEEALQQQQAHQASMVSLTNRFAHHQYRVLSAINRVSHVFGPLEYNVFAPGTVVAVQSPVDKSPWFGRVIGFEIKASCLSNVAVVALLLGSCRSYLENYYLTDIYADDHPLYGRRGVWVGAYVL